MLKDTNSNRKRSASALSIIHRKKPHHISNNKKNLKQILILSFDALKERKARSALTILMVIVGGGLMISINGVRVLL